MYFHGNQQMLAGSNRGGVFWALQILKNPAASVKTWKVYFTSEDIKTENYKSKKVLS